MWTQLSHFILRNRLVLIISLFAITAMMGYLGRNVQMSYDYAKVVPADDPDMIFYKEFKETFGEDGNIMAVGMQDASVFTLDKFNQLKSLKDDLVKLEGIDEVVTIHDLPVLMKDMENQQFIPEKIFKKNPESQEELDSLLQLLADTKLYEGQFINNKNNSMLFLVTMNDDYLNSKKRIALVEKLMARGEVFEKGTDIQLHYAGLPYLRSVLAGKVKAELEMFLIISVAVTALILFLFFRSFSPMFYSLIVIGMVVVWVIGFLGIFEFRMTMLTGLLPPILVVIGIPNCIYLLNKYHQEFALHGNKAKALSSVIRKIGVVTLITNTTTAIGFVVLTTTEIVIMKEFAIVASLNILATFMITIIFIPAVFSYLPSPKARHVRHLKFKPVNKIIEIFSLIVEKYRTPVYVVTVILVVIAINGALKIEALTYMADDLPEQSELKRDLSFFETNFEGVMPLEIVVDTRKPKGIRKSSNQKIVNKLEEYLSSIPEVTRPVSMLSFIKAANQAYWDGNPKKYVFPRSKNALNNVLLYLKNQEDSTGLLESFVDDNQQRMRISMKIADIGSIKLDSLVKNQIEPSIAEIVGKKKIDVKVTGTTLLYTKGNGYLIDNLRISMIIAFFLIAAIMGLLFRNVRMILISLIPNIIPLLITAGLMGYLGIPLKPSTALVFSIAFGISVDDSIHFLAKYRQELLKYKFDVVKSVQISLQETGMSMIYTSIVLFCGFVIFVASEFGGTKALGALTSTTLLIAMVTNLILLPCLLRTFDLNSKQVKLAPMFKKYDDVYQKEDEGAEGTAPKKAVAKEQEATSKR